jgi:esterase/lipase
MLPLAELINQAGYQVLVPRLAGHRGRVEETLQDPSEIWIRQIHEFGTSLRRPLLCAGYSMGGLLVTERFLAGDLKCERFVLFAPAFATYIPAGAAGLVRRFLPTDFLVRSGIPQAYKHLDHTGLGSAQAVLEFIRKLQQRLAESNDLKAPPGLVFFDPQDQVVDAAETIRLIKKYFPHWRIVEVKTLPLDETHAFHMVVDEPHVGPEQWRKMAEEIREFLKH